MAGRLTLAVPLRLCDMQSGARSQPPGTVIAPLACISARGCTVMAVPPHGISACLWAERRHLASWWPHETWQQGCVQCRTCTVVCYRLGQAARMLGVADGAAVQLQAAASFRPQDLSEPQLWTSFCVGQASCLFGGSDVWLARCFIDGLVAKLHGRAEWSGCMCAFERQGRLLGPKFMRCMPMDGAVAPAFQGAPLLWALLLQGSFATQSHRTDAVLVSW